MATQTIFTGDSIYVTVNVKKDGVAFPIPSGSTVTAGLVTESGNLLAGPWSVSSGTTGSNWSSGTAVVLIDGSATAGLKPQICKLEIQVVKDGTTTTRTSKERIDLKQGGLP